MNIWIILLIIAAIVLFVIWPAFRDFIIDQALNIALIVVEGLRRYYRVALVALVISIVLLIVAAWIPAPSLKAIAFLLAALLTMVVWLPVGLLIKLFHLRDDSRKVFPAWIKAIVSWICFFGFISVVFPHEASRPIVIFGALLLWGFYSGLSSRFDFLNRVAPAIVAVLLVWVGWKYIAPDSYRATARFLNAQSGLLYANADRSSVAAEASAKATYGYMLKDVSVAYEVVLKDDTIAAIVEVPVELKQDSLFLLVNHKRENYAFDGQTFVEIKLPNSNGSFVTGRKVWIEADLIRIGPRRSIDVSLAAETGGNASGSGVIMKSESSTLHKGEIWSPNHYFPAGEPIVYTVEYAPLFKVNKDGTKILVDVGRHDATMETAGTPNFEGADGLSKVTVTYRSFRGAD